MTAPAYRGEPLQGTLPSCFSFALLLAVLMPSTVLGGPGHGNAGHPSGGWNSQGRPPGPQPGWGRHGYFNGPYWGPYGYGGFGLGLGYGLGYGYGYPYYGYGMGGVVVESSPPPVYIQNNQAGQYWNFCRSRNGYYPYVQECPEGWKAVPITPR